MEWLEVAKALKLGDRVYEDCACGKGRTLAINHRNKGYSTFCFRCDRKDWHPKGRLSIAEITAMKALNEEAKSFKSKIELPEDFSLDIPVEGRLWLYRASITESLIKQYRIGYSEKLQRVIVPVYRYNKLIWFIGRAVHKGQEPKYIAPSESKDKVLFYSGRVKDRVVVTEDILSAIRIGQVSPAASVLGTKLSMEQLTQLIDVDVTLWLDGDIAGRKASKSMEKDLSMVTSVRSVVTDRDPKMLTNKEIKDVLCELI